MYYSPLGLTVVCIQNKTYFRNCQQQIEKKNSSLDISEPKIDTIWLDDVTVQSKFLKYYLKRCVLSVIIIKAVYIGKLNENMAIIAGVMIMRRNLMGIRPKQSQQIR